jgi:hypothetical protein
MRRRTSCPQDFTSTASGGSAGRIATLPGLMMSEAAWSAMSVAPLNLGASSGPGTTPTCLRLRPARRLGPDPNDHGGFQDLAEKRAGCKAVMMSAADRLRLAVPGVVRMSRGDTGEYLQSHRSYSDRGVQQPVGSGPPRSRGACVHGPGTSDQKCRWNHPLTRSHQCVNMLPWRARSAPLTCRVPSWRSWASSCSTSRSIWSTSWRWSCDTTSR